MRPLVSGLSLALCLLSPPLALAAPNPTPNTPIPRKRPTQPQPPAPAPAPSAPAYTPPRVDPNYPPDLLPVSRTLSPLEVRALRESAARLRTEGAAQLRSGNILVGLGSWERELQAHQRLGDRTAMAENLGRIGAQATKLELLPVVQSVDLRLQQLVRQADSQGPPLAVGTVLQLARAYERMNQPLPAIPLYQRLLVLQRANRDQAGQVVTLSALSRLSEGSFRDTEAVQTQEQLLPLVRERGDQRTELQTLLELERTATSLGDRTRSATARQGLIAIYQQQQNLGPLPELQLRLAQDYEALNQPDQAAQAYQEAFALARTQRQFYVATDSLNRLALLYAKREDYSRALQTYNLLQQVQLEADNRLGLLDTYAAIGDLYVAQANDTEAIAAYRQGLNAAPALGRQDLFLNRLALLYVKREDYANALQTYNQLLAAQQAAGNRQGSLDTYVTMGDLYADQAKYAEAIATYQQGLDVAQALGRQAVLQARIARIQEIQADQ